MEFPTDLLSKMNIGDLIAIAAMFWFFNTRLDKKFEKIDQRLEKIDQRLEKLEGRILSLENSNIEIKTILRMKECCMIGDERQMKKAE